MAIPFRLFANYMVKYGLWGLRTGGKGLFLSSKVLAVPALYGLSQSAFKINVKRLDDFMGYGDRGNMPRDENGRYALSEFDIEIAGETVPVQIRWKEEKDASFYTFCLLMGTTMYWTAVRYYYVRYANARALAQSNTIALTTAQRAKAVEEAKTLESLIAKQPDVIDRTIDMVKSGGTGDTDEIVKLTVESLEAQKAELLAFESLDDAAKARYLDDVRAINNANVKTTVSAIDNAKAKKGALGASKLLKFVGVIDIAFFLGTGVLSLILPEEDEQMLLESTLDPIFGDGFTEKYNLTMPLGITDIALAVGIYHAIDFFAEDLSELGIPTTADAFLIFILAIMEDYWEVYVGVPELNFDLTEYFDGQIEDLGLSSRLFLASIDKIRNDPYLFLEIIIGVFTVRVIWVTYGGLLMKAVGQGSPATA